MFVKWLTIVRTSSPSLVADVNSCGISFKNALEEGKTEEKARDRVGVRGHGGVNKRNV